MRLGTPHRRFLLVLVILMTGCTLNNALPSNNQNISGVPAVRIILPQPNATYLSGVAVNIQAAISNAGADIDRVEIVIDGETVATLSDANPNNAATFNVTHGWSATTEGTHSINVTAYRADGSSSEPATVDITVIGQGDATATQALPSATTSQASQQNNANTTQEALAHERLYAEPTDGNLRAGHQRAARTGAGIRPAVRSICRRADDANPRHEQ
jgi:hypothetical protein